MDFDDFIQKISGSRPPLEVDVDDEVMDLMDASYKIYKRADHETTFEEWLGRNPVGLQYLKKMIANLKKNKKRRCPDCDGKGQYYGSGTYHDCPRCNTSGIIKEAIDVSVDPNLQSIIDHARSEYEYWIKTFCDDKEDPPVFEVWLGSTALGRNFIKQIISKVAAGRQSGNGFSESFSRDEVPTQEEVRRFLERYHNELHYLYELDPVLWDEYDLSNWRSLVRRKGRYGWHENVNEDRMQDNPYSKFLNAKPTPVSTASEERTCPICNGDCETEGKECWKCHGTGTVYKGVTKESMNKQLNESGGDFEAAEENGYTLTGWVESRGEDTPSGQSISFYIMAPGSEEDEDGSPIWTSRTFDPCDRWSGEWDEDKVDKLVEKAKQVLHRYATGKRKDRAKWYKYNPKTGEHDILVKSARESMESKFKFNQLADQLCESLADQPIFVHARSAYNKMARIKNAVLTSATTIRLQMEDNSSVDMSLTDENHNYQLVLNDGQFVTARDVARIFGLLEPDRMVTEKRTGKKKLNEGTRYGRGFPYRLDFVKNDKVVGSKVIKNRDDLEHQRHWITQQDSQGAKLKKKTLRGAVKESSSIPTHWRNNIPMSRRERQDIAKLRKAGCQCELPLLGQRPYGHGYQPRCRLCNAEYYPE